MNDNIIDAEERFPRKGKRQTDGEELENQTRKDGAAVLRRLKRRGFKLSPNDREKIARNIGREMKTQGILRKTLGTEADKDSRQLYCLVLRENEQAAYNRLYASSVPYIDIITALAKLSGMNQNVLAGRITYGTSFHPSSGPTSSDVEWMTHRVYELVDGLEEEFKLLERFKQLSQMKASLDDTNPYISWPTNKDEYLEETLLDSYQAQLLEKNTFWPVFKHKYIGKEPALFNDFSSFDSNDSLEIVNSHWIRIVGYLPHCFLGCDDNFDWDHDFWPVPDSVYEDFRQNGENAPSLVFWKKRIREQLVNILGDVSKLHIGWQDSNEMLINGEPSDVYLNKFLKHRYIVTKELFEQSSDEDPEYLEWLVDEFGVVLGTDQPSDISSFRDPINHHWLCIYPNHHTSEIIPVFVTTNAGATGNYSFVTPFTERMLMRASNTRLIDGSTIGERLMKYLEIESHNEEPILKAEWRRTALFIEHHPLYKKWKRMQATESHIRKWREEL